ncbi:MAG: DUF4102 domain-containing protein [Deltaproteobacteria bacterium]|nr:DUF4102 domain-containing protein [Deltaproteobacteria bacterium]
MTLTNTQISKAKPTDKPYKLFDEKGLYLKVAPSGGKLWRFKYRFNDKENSISLGAYPDVSLKRAREKRDEARTLLADGINPSQQRKDEKIKQVSKSENIFSNIGKEWLQKQSSKWTHEYSECRVPLQMRMASQQIEN